MRFYLVVPNIIGCAFHLFGGKIIYIFMEGKGYFFKNRAAVKASDVTNIDE